MPPFYGFFCRPALCPVALLLLHPATASAPCLEAEVPPLGQVMVKTEELQVVNYLLPGRRSAGPGPAGRPVSLPPLLPLPVGAA